MAGSGKKITLARTLYRDSQIVILDEPTSSFDMESEIEILKHIRESAQQKIIILISHRLTALLMVDRIYVLDDGNIVEQGSHVDLMKNKEAYVELFRRQIENGSSPLTNL